jgi:AraC-like DNA-binding protein
MGIDFKPGGAFPFLTLPANELHNEVVSLEMLWGSAVGDLRDQLLDAETPESKFHILEQLLLTQAACPLNLHPAVSYALRAFQYGPNIQTISDITEQISLSTRRFIQVFNEQVGLTPKLFCRIRRFQEVLHMIGSGQQNEWSDIAFAGGYFDQAHFNHDFLAFSGLKPTAYLIHRSELFNHVSVP